MNKSGFTAVEMLVAILVGSLILIGAYQLFSVVYQSHAAMRLRSQASNIAYAHLRQISNSLSMSDCKNYTVRKTHTPASNEDLPNLKINSILSAPYGCSVNILRIEVVVEYTNNGQPQSEKQAIYVNKQ